MKRYRTLQDEDYQPSEDYYIEGEQQKGMSVPHDNDAISHREAPNPFTPQPPIAWSPHKYFGRKLEQQQPGKARKYPTSGATDLRKPGAPSSGGVQALRAQPPADIGAPVEFGRPIITNPDGSRTTEYTTTTERDGRWYNVPTVMNGAVLPSETVESLFQHHLAPDVGNFDTMDHAVQAARERTKRIHR